MRSSRCLVAAGLTVLLALGAPLSAHADDAVPAEPAATSSVPAPDEPADEPGAEIEPPTEQNPEPEPTPTPTPTPSPTDEPEAPEEPEAPAGDPSVTTVKDAQLRWSLNALLHQPPHFGKNFLTAGLLADTAGGVMPSSRWKQADGAVRIERAAGSSYGPATWDGFGTGTDHQVVIDGGTGTVDAARRSARITWRGSFGVGRYSGMTNFSVSDPVLVVENGVGRLEGTMSGFGVSRDGNGAGDATGPIGPTKVVLADLGSVDLSDPAGLTRTPVFYGVRVDHADQKQDPTKGWGSFPASFISFVDQVGQAPFWMTSGSDDDAKAPSPVAVSFDAAAPVTVTPPPVKRRTAKPQVTNPTRPAPPAPTTVLPQAQPSFVPATVPTDGPAPVAAPLVATPANTVSLTAASAPVLVAADGDSSDLGWWIAVSFLLMSAAAVAAPTLLARPRTS